ncbi:MAG: hypothetical protein WAX07_04245 [Candidatus Altiarchaeia archaeon]
MAVLFSVLLLLCALFFPAIPLFKVKQSTGDSLFSLEQIDKTCHNVACCLPSQDEIAVAGAVAGRCDYVFILMVLFKALIVFSLCILLAALVPSWRIARVLKFDNSVYGEIVSDKQAFYKGFPLFILFSVAGSIGAVGSLNDNTIWAVLWRSVLVLALWALVISLGHLIAKMLGGTANFMDYEKVSFYAYAPEMLAIVPYVGVPIGLMWRMMCVISATKEAHKLKGGKVKVFACCYVLLSIISYAPILLPFDVSVQYGLRIP